jgi:magnesium-transporting ATPase (P-type)
MDESSLTGESNHITKEIQQSSNDGIAPILYSDCKVVVGSGLMIVGTVGDQLHTRNILVVVPEKVPTALQSKLEKMARYFRNRAHQISALIKEDVNREL